MLQRLDGEYENGMVSDSTCISNTFGKFYISKMDCGLVAGRISPPLADIVRFGLLCIAVSLTVLKHVY